MPSMLRRGCVGAVGKEAWLDERQPAFYRKQDAH